MKTNVQLFNSSRKYKIVRIWGTFRLQRIDTKKQAEENGRTIGEIGCNKVLCKQGLHLGGGEGAGG